MDWKAVLQKKRKPPIVPAKQATRDLPKDEQTGVANPYALLNKNFESEFYDRDICMWKEKPLSPPNMGSESSNLETTSCHLSNFTYDKL